MVSLRAAGTERSPENRALLWSLCCLSLREADQGRKLTCPSGTYGGGMGRVTEEAEGTGGSLGDSEGLLGTMSQEEGWREECRRGPARAGTLGWAGV